MKNPKFQLFQGNNGEYYFRLHAANGQVILRSEGYTTKRAAQNGIESVRKNAADDNRFARKESSDGRFYFALTATNGQTVGMSQMYKRPQNRDKGIASVQRVAAAAPVEDVTEAVAA